ncbi:relaxase, partial [Blautia obeum]|nr:relaxase [Blautia obeum]
DNKLEKYYNMDFGKESMEHEFERNARTAEAEQSKRAASRVKPTEPDRAGKQSAQRSVGDVERELRGIDEAVKSRTSKGRAEQAERRRAEQEAHQRAEAERRAAEEQQRVASRRYIGRGWELER